MVDVFISYSQKDRTTAKRLADFLTHQGYEVWWDAELVGGSKFRHEINTQLVDAKASIVIWTPNSVESEWVVEEAEEAKHLDKLIATRTEDVDYRAIPLGFRSIQTDLITEPDRLLRALKNKGIQPSRPPVVAADGSGEHAAAIAKAEQVAHWEFIKESDNPADFARFIAKYPDSGLVELAQQRLNVLAPPPPPPKPVSQPTYTPPVYDYEPEYVVERRRWPWVLAIIVVLAIAAMTELGAPNVAPANRGLIFAATAGIGLALILPVWLLVRFRSVRMITMIGLGAAVSALLLPFLGFHWTFFVPDVFIPAFATFGDKTYGLGPHVVIAAMIIVPLWILLRVRRRLRRRRY